MVRQPRKREVERYEGEGRNRREEAEGRGDVAAEGGRDKKGKRNGEGGHDPTGYETRLGISFSRDRVFLTLSGATLRLFLLESEHAAQLCDSPPFSRLRVPSRSVATYNRLPPCDHCGSGIPTTSKLIGSEIHPPFSSCSSSVPDAANVFTPVPFKLIDLPLPRAFMHNR